MAAVLLPVAKGVPVLLSLCPSDFRGAGCTASRCTLHQCPQPTTSQGHVLGGQLAEPLGSAAERQLLKAQWAGSLRVCWPGNVTHGSEAQLHYQEGMILEWNGGSDLATPRQVHGSAHVHCSTKDPGSCWGWNCNECGSQGSECV